VWAGKRIFAVEGGAGVRAAGVEVFQDGSSYAHRLTEDLDVPHATFDAPAELRPSA
jgi:hypothetical protein